MLPNDFYKKVEDPTYLKHTLYSDTDSVYLCIPHKHKEATVEEKWNESVKVSEEINQTIIDYLNEFVFKKANIDPTHNNTYFKTEALMDSIGFLPDTKKYYAYKLLVDEGKFLSDEDKKKQKDIKYKNISIKSNLAKMSSNLLQDMLNNVVLNSEIHHDKKLDSLSLVIDKWYKFFHENISQYKLDDIGIPNKWSKAAQIINAMKAYNLIMKKEIFTPGTAGKYVYCTFKNISLFMSKNSDIDIKNLNALAVPYTYDPNILEEKMKEYSIEINSKEHWDKCIFTTTCHKIIQMLKNS